MHSIHDTAGPSANPPPRPWFSQPNLSRRKAAAIAVATALALTVVNATVVGEQLTARLARALDFKARDRAGATRTLSPRLKVFVLDNTTVQALGRPSLTNNEWAKLIAAVNRAHPARIIIDQTFAAPVRDENLAAFAAALRGGAPAVAGAFSSDVEPGGLAPLAVRKDHDPAGIVRAGGGVPASWLAAGGRFAYGPAPELADGFAHVGHLMVEDFGFVKPFIGVGATADGGPRQLVPHAAFYAAERLEVADSTLLVDGRAVPLDAAGRIVTNLHRQAFFGTQLLPLQKLFAAAKGATVPASVSAGDVVFIAPLYFTGHTDFKDTAAGKLPGALIVASLLNSVLTGEWVRPLAPAWLFILLGSVLGVTTAFSLNGLRFSFALGAGVLATAAAGIGAFVAADLAVPWPLSAAAVLLAGGVAYTEKSRESERKALHLRLSFKNALAPGNLQTLTDHPETLEVAAAQRTVSVMFIDVVGFSLYSETKDPGSVFADLKVLLGEITAAVHEFGGVVDKTLGDGVLAFFGYRYDGSATDADHADRAVRCALAIQRRALRRNLTAAREGRPLHPLRIGVNSETVYIGNLGDADRVDFTIIGNGVNFAKRIEEACEIYRIMFATATRALLTDPLLTEARIEPRLIMIKHRSEPIEVCELDPFAANQAALQEGLRDYWNSLGISKRETRRGLPDALGVKVCTRFGDGALQDFSLSGLSFELERYLAKGIELEFDLDSADGSLKRELDALNLLPLMGQMRWGSPCGSRYLHGVIVRNLNNAQKEALFAVLERHVKSRQQAAA
jgi:class 3 adenylate cyclase/CHASE2 domain-containing sensor protein